MFYVPIEDKDAAEDDSNNVNTGGGGSSSSGRKSLYQRRIKNGGSNEENDDPMRSNSGTLRSAASSAASEFDTPPESPSLASAAAARPAINRMVSSPAAVLAELSASREELFALRKKASNPSLASGGNGGLNFAAEVGDDLTAKPPVPPPR